MPLGLAPWRGLISPWVPRRDKHSPSREIATMSSTVTTNVTTSRSYLSYYRRQNWWFQSRMRLHWRRLDFAAAISYAAMKPWLSWCHASRRRRIPATPLTLVLLDIFELPPCFFQCHVPRRLRLSQASLWALGQPRTASHRHRLTTAWCSFCHFWFRWRCWYGRNTGRSAAPLLRLRDDIIHYHNWATDAWVRAPIPILSRIIHFQAFSRHDWIRPFLFR